ncbi:hypothetical protein BS636_09790 [Acinetobacter sp. LoGeW2-3]|uniref:hypothetical protein n=1 Tax=Acinetobacter sp. LoGeW2-3 TaxID=1808001 RepID=UPI000C05AE26|nr:hypothetical protein [Acinetobacter sp. LoGeW2-3]ATO19921.1 hypothetical protein BS636_09790 [Acinetobacter sp. LoGeW2-3]
MKTVLMAISIVLFPLHTSAKDVWECNNAILQSLCQHQNCSQNYSSSSPDKLRISVNNHKYVSICAENSCWNDEASTVYINAQSLLQLPQIRWVDRDYPQSSQNYVLSINRDTQSIFFKGDRDNHPVQCRTV